MNAKRVRRRTVAKLLLMVLGFVSGSIAAEIALRVVGYSYSEFYSLDQSRGYGLRPNAQGWYRKEGEAYVRINSDGLRDREHSITKPENTVRIAVLGDSYPEAFSVPMEEAFWAVMERKLQECDAFPGKKVEVINFGVSGYGTAQELLTLRGKVWRYSPDIVLLTVTTNNDLVDNVRQLKKTDEIPYFVYHDNRLTIDDSFKNSRAFVWRQSAISRLGRWFRDRSRLVQAVIEGPHGLKIRLASWRAQRSQSTNPSTPAPSESTNSRQRPDLLARSEELGTDNLIYLEPANAVWNDAWRVTEDLIVEMRDEVKARGAKFAVVTLSNGPQVLPDPNSREAFKGRFGIVDLFYPDNRITSLAVREGIPVLTLAPELQEYAEHNKTFLHGFGTNVGNGHWNATGHRVAGELIAEKICEGTFLK